MQGAKPLRVNNKSKNTNPRRSLLSTNGFLLAFGLCLVAISVFLWKSQEAKNLSQLHLSTESKARSYSSETEIRYNGIYNALRRLASRDAPRDEIDAVEWEEDATYYIDIFEGMKSIAWVDETLRIRRIVPLQDNMSYMNQKVDGIVWDPLDVNVWMASNDGTEFNGYVLGTIDTGAIISPVVSELDNDYMLRLSNEGTTVFISENWNRPREEFAVGRTITFREAAVLGLSFAPTDELFSSEIADARKTLIVGLFLSFIAIIAVYFAQNHSAIAILSELRYRNLFEASQDALFLVNLNGEYLDANPAATTMVGYSLAELQQMTVDDLQIQNETRPPGVLSRMWAEAGMRETFLRHKNGRTIPVDLLISPVREGDVQKYTLGITRDITTRKKAQEALKEYSERLEEMVEERTQELRDAQEQLVRREKLAVLGQLAGGVGHELRNPLGVISNAVFYLKMVKPDADDTTKEYLHMISAEVHNADRIISDLLDFARIRPADRERIAVSQLVARGVEKHPPPEGVQVTTDIAADLPPAYVDPHQIELVLGNLMTNACQAMPQGGRLIINAGRGDPRGRPAGGRPEVSISITDTGCGISPENSKHLFEPLFTTKARGIGLGLAISKNLVEANGGRIEVESEEGVGSTFTVWLPTGREEDYVAEG